MELDTMNKTELRAACKEKGIKSFSKMTVAGMREALTMLTTPAEPVVKDEPAPKTEREEKNGVRRPIKGVCADVWSALDKLRANGEDNLTTAIHAIGEKNGWNRNNVACELSAYRRHHGLTKPKKKAS